MIKKLLTIFAILISITTFNSTSHSIEADVFVQSTVNRAASTLGGNLSKQQRVEELKKIAKERLIYMESECTPWAQLEKV